MDYPCQMSNLIAGYEALIESNSKNRFGEINDYRLALESLHIVYDQLPPTPLPKMTIPVIFHMEYKENFISDYFAYIIDPERNGIGNDPLKKFLQFTFPEIKDWDWETPPQIIREYPLYGRRIDLLILWEDNKVIGIENKIYHQESDNQTRDYATSITQLFPNCDHYFVFLTLKGDTPGSEVFRSLSYRKVLEILKTISSDRIADIKRRVLWEDFLIHIEEYLIMDNNSQTPFDMAKLNLYIKNYKMIKDLKQTYEKSKQTIFDLISAQVESHLEDDWIIEFNPSLGYQLIYKQSWYLKNPPLRVFYCYFFNSDILLEDHFYFTILVQGYDDQWEKAPEIPQFIDLFSPRHKLLLDKYKSAGLDFLPQRITINNFIKKQAIACKKYPFVVNLDEFESVAEQITKPMFEVEFLIKPIEDTLDEFITRYRK